ncbi:uncharacterized protein LOC131429015 [Malaya genurostris]|uniref:uncharacterized protein LOC131429015 n=1 Tax=Malaya genurostris TaxID=325434 RepID=UPI0026F3E542|nr:uncharacterized protein LOC131429015 [Malaya genurostris]
MASFEDDYFMLKAFLASVTAKRVVEPGQPQQSQSSRSFKLPEIKLPEFGGNILEWFSFYDTFESLVHDNRELSDVQRFYYLKSTLRGEALKLVEKISVTGDNYSVALKMITDRYQNTNILIRNHIEALFKVDKVKKECPRALTNLVGEFENNLGILEKMGEDIKGWSSLLVYMITSRLDPATFREWQRIADKKRMPKYDELITFLRDYIVELEILHVDRTVDNRTYSPNATPAITSNQKESCPVCGKGHRLYYCDQFKHLPLSQRTSIVSKAGLCANCLFGKHSFVSCKYGACRECGAKHHSLLHNPLIDTPSTSDTAPAVSNVVIHYGELSDSPSSTIASCKPLRRSETHSVTSRFDHPISTQVFLATAIVKVFGPKGNSFLARVLLDSASQPNLMTERFRQLLNARKTPDSTEIAGIGGEIAAVATCSTVATIASRFNNFRVPLEFIVMEKVTNDLPAWTVDSSDWSIPENIRLADPSFATKGPIDIVIGAQIFFEIIRNGHVKISDDKPLLQNSVFGWLVSGLHQSGQTGGNIRSNCNIITYRDLDQRICRFWELEACQSSSVWSVEERLCENVFGSTTHRDKNGRYIVSLPKKAELVGQLGHSLSIATRRFHSLERRFAGNPELRSQYTNFMKEYLALGHMKLVDPVVDCPGHHFYLPHHAVFKPDSTTTKLRVVFDGSCKTTSGFSLNDLLLKGPTVQDDMILTILRFRAKAVVVTADITKMYRQIWVAEEDQPLQRVLWRNSPSEPLCTYELTTVTYGTTTAPYLATRCLQQLAEDEAINFPLAVPVVTKGFYVDDLMFGFDTLEEAIVASRETSQMLTSAGFSLRKWSANHREVLAQFPESYLEKSAILELDRSAPVKALGLLWKPESDEFLFKVPEWPENPISTKRSILSHVCSLFDPLGLISPVIILTKMLIQTLWERNFGWDDPLPQILHERWTEISRQLTALKHLTIPRFVFSDQMVSTEMHGFSDASQRAYGACIYFRSVTMCGTVTSRLVAAKSRIAPLEKRRPTLARLELCAALLLANLQKRIQQCLELQCPVYLWSDSTITLHWIAGQPSSWNSFVANRVAEIQQLTQSATWLHIPTADNPADHISRGLSGDSIIGNSLWWYGPQWYLKPHTDWPETIHSWKSKIPPEIDFERRKAIVLTAVCTAPTDAWIIEYLKGHDSLHNALRILTHCQRFINNCKLQKNHRVTGFITCQEIRSIEIRLIRQIQIAEFPKDFENLQRKNPIDSKSSLRYLKPIMLDDELLIRVGGRLKNAPISFDSKYPILIPKNHPFTELLFHDSHENTLHSGPSHLLAAVHRRYWPIDGRNKARVVVHRCLTCFRNKPTFAQQTMADLPPVRVTPSRPFVNIGVDFLGPVYIKPPRKQDPIKAYVCVFVCMVTKAAHLELVMNLSTEAFLAALRRFCARRGYPLNIYCDNATNFTGASKELHELRRLFHSQQHKLAVIGESTRLGITFHFIPPRSPSFGGLWEACVKSTKHILNRVTLDVILTQEEMSTTVAQIEACLNSRPLTPISNDPTDLEALTPGHFLIGAPLQSLPEPDLCSLSVNRLSRWQLMQRILQSFWSRWYLEYLPALQKLQKWPGIHPNLSVGDMVLVQEENQPPTKWPIARVVNAIAGDDKCVRVADVLLGDNKIYRRSIRKMCPLPLYETQFPIDTKVERQSPAPECTQHLAPTITHIPTGSADTDDSEQSTSNPTTPNAS